MNKYTLTNADTHEGVSCWSETGEGYRVDLRTLHGGKQEGSQLLTIQTNDMVVILIPTRGLGIHSIETPDMHIGGWSPVTEVVHPSFMNLESRNGLGWLEGFHEFLCRCGLEWSGHPGDDEIVNNVGEKEKMPLTLHGKIANIPVAKLAVTIDTDVILIEAETREKLFHGPKLIMHTRVSIPFTGTALHITDIVENQSSQPQEMQMLYHVNVGKPILGEGAKVVLNPVSNTPFNDRAKEGLATYDTYEKPTPGFVEQVYCLELQQNARGMVHAMLQNPAGDKGVMLTYKKEQLPYFTLWKYSNAEQDGYVTGIEPGTSFPRNRKIEREAGRVPVIAPGASRTFDLTIDVVGSREDVDRNAAMIRGE